ncbi:MAG TPA: hypothetical protein VGQ83_40735 [Polyangia bacterium]|jgi:hypothetical protein
MARALLVAAVALVIPLWAGCGDTPPPQDGLRKVWVDQLLKHGYSKSDNVAYGEGDNMGGFEKRAEHEFYSPEHQVRVTFKAIEIKPDQPGDLYSFNGVVRFERESANSKAIGATYYKYGRRTKTWIRKEESAMK